MYIVLKIFVIFDIAVQIFRVISGYGNTQEALM